MSGRGRGNRDFPVGIIECFGGDGRIESLESFAEASGENVFMVIGPLGFQFTRGDIRAGENFVLE